MQINKNLILAVVLLASAHAVAAEDSYFDDRWYIAPSVGVVKLAGARETKRDDLYYALGFGRFFTPNLSLDLHLDRYPTKFRSDFPVPEGASDRFNLWSYGLVGRYYFGGQNIRPYGLLGLGIQEHRNFLDDGRDIYGSVGLGVLTRLGESADLRLQVEARRDNDRDTFDRERGFNDYIGTAGLTIKFGQVPRAPAPEPPPEPREPPPPPPPPAPEPEPEVLIEFDSAVTFDFDSARLRPEAVAELNRAVNLLKQHPEIRRVEVAGHTCDIGPADYNQGLSERRAGAVANYLIENGIDRSRLVVRGFGENQPKVPNTSEENRRKNRRVAVTVLERR